MIGASGTYAINGTDFTLKPTTAKWVDRDNLGMDGNGRPIYPAVRSFEMNWQLIDADSLVQLIGFFNSVQNTGTVTVDLPKWGTAPHQFERYSGCTLSEPMVNEFFEDNTQNVRMLIYGIVAQ